MMDLLDLPPEIFQKIIASYVHKVGVSEAWERRDVCSECHPMISQHELIRSRNICRLHLRRVLWQTARDQIRTAGRQTNLPPTRKAVPYIPVQKLVRGSDTTAQSRP